MAEPILNLSAGFPCAVALKRSTQMLMALATEDTVNEEANFVPPLQYGRPAGNDFPREEFSKFLSKEYNENVSMSEIFIGAGASASLFFVGHQLLPGCKFLTEDVTFFMGKNIIKKDLKREIIPVKLTSRGIDLVELENKMKALSESCPEDQPYSCGFYTIPTFHNPTGICYDAETSIAVAKLAKRYNALVICDDVYNLLFYEGEQCPRRLRSYAKEVGCGDNVVSIGSFSKLCGPGLRCGWVECAPALIEKMGGFWVQISGCNLGHFPSYLLANTMKKGSLSEHIQFLRNIYKERMDYFVDEVKKILPKGSTLNNAKGGYFLWVELPSNYDTNRLEAIAMDKHKLKFHAGQKFSVTAEKTNCIRMSISYQNMEGLKMGVQKLDGAIKDLEKEMNP